MNQPKIAFLIEEGLSPEKRSLLERITQTLHRRFHAVVFDLPGGRGSPSKTLSTSPLQLAERLHKEGFSLVLAPEQLYLNWKAQVDTLDIQEKLGRIWAGYSLDPLELRSVWSSLTQGEIRLLDFSSLQESELLTLVSTLAYPGLRAGMQGLFIDYPSPTYCENWNANSGLGLRLDQVLNLPEINSTHWRARSQTLRMLVLLLWNHFEQSQAPTGYFQIAAHPDLLALRLTFRLESPDTLITGLRSDYPSSASLRPSAYEGLILSSHFFRLHRISGQPDVEITIGLFGSIPEVSPQDQSHFVCIDTMHSRWLLSSWDEIPNPHAPHLRVLPPVTLTRQGPRVPGTPPGSSRLSEIVEDFQKRFFEAQYEIRQVELKLVEMARKGATPQEIKALQAKIDSLSYRESQWIRQLSQVLSSKRRSPRTK